MEDALSAGVLRGRPFGGVSISWSPDINHFVIPLTNYKHKRVVAVELKTAETPIIIMSIYMPFFNTSKRVECMQDTVDCLSMIDLIMEDHPNHFFIVGGDLNCELKGDSPFDPLWADFASKHQLTYCDELFSSPGYTYHHDSLGHRKFNDHFIVSKELMDNKSLLNHKIIDEGENTSDHLPILMSLSQKFENSNINAQPTPTAPSVLNWDKVDVGQKTAYAARLSSLLHSFPLPSSIVQCRSLCKCDSVQCKLDLQKEYESLVDCILKASASIPRLKRGVQKDWWTPELTKLKEKSVAIHNLWIAEGRPRNGATHWERLSVRAAYKKALRLAKRAPKEKAWNKLHSAMEAKDTDTFWKWWQSVYSKNGGRSAPVVENCTTKETITKVFETVFQKNSEPNNPVRVGQMKDDFDREYHDFVNSHNNNCDCSATNVTLASVIDGVCCMKSGKSADDDGMQAEHLLNAPLDLLARISFLFNAMLTHSFVPQQFRLGTIIPLIKDRQGKNSDANNYRGITISPMISKLFEHVLKTIYADHLATSTYQFGFKKGSSTSHALFCLRESINYYIDHGSRVYCSFLDASKAFDRLIHAGLFTKLMKRGIPKKFLDVIIAWYDGLQCRVRWDGYLGSWFSIQAGVRQGGVLSPDFYSIYVDELITILKSSGIGCYVHNIFAAAMFYADDMAIIAPSIKGLQRLLDICGAYCDKWDICLNAKKTRNMSFGTKKEVGFQVTLNGVNVQWAVEWKYLGVVLKSGKRFGCSVKDRVKSFYRALNAVLRVEGRSNDMIFLRLIETHCAPILTYAIEIVHVADRDERRSLRVAYNAIFRKIFSYRYFESVTALQHRLERQTWEEVVQTCQSRFLKRAKQCDRNTLVYKLAMTTQLLTPS